MNPKHSLVFFSSGVILILGFVLIGIASISVIPESKLDDGNKEQLTIEKNITISTDSKTIDEMNCTELNEFILSFEHGWGGAISLYNKKCS